MVYQENVEGTIIMSPREKSHDRLEICANLRFAIAQDSISAAATL